MKESYNVQHDFFYCYGISILKKQNRVKDNVQSF